MGEGTHLSHCERTEVLSLLRLFSRTSDDDRALPAPLGSKALRTTRVPVQLHPPCHSCRPPTFSQTQSGGSDLHDTSSRPPFTWNTDCSARLRPGDSRQLVHKTEGLSFLYRECLLLPLQKGDGSLKFPAQFSLASPPWNLVRFLWGYQEQGPG